MWSSDPRMGGLQLFVQSVNFFFAGFNYFHIYLLRKPPFCCFVSLFRCCCSHTLVFRTALVHETHVFNTHTEWNLLSTRRVRVLP